MRLFVCNSLHAAVIGAILLGASLPAKADDDPSSVAANEFFTVDVESLVAKFDKSHIVSDPPIVAASFYQMDTAPLVVVPSDVEAYLLLPEGTNHDVRNDWIVGMKPSGKQVSGKLFILQRHPDHPRDSVLAKFDFEVAANPQGVATREDFLRAKGRFFQRLWSEQMAGSAMFRHLAAMSLDAVGEPARFSGPSWPLGSRPSADDTIALLSGGRAVSENLQLDVQLTTAEQNSTAAKPLSDVPGITVREIDWSGLLTDQHTELDPLAKLISHDQYGVFLPSFDVLVRWIERGSEALAPIAQWVEPQSRKTDWLGFLGEWQASGLRLCDWQGGCECTGGKCQ